MVDDGGGDIDPARESDEEPKENQDGARDAYAEESEDQIFIGSTRTLSNLSHSLRDEDKGVGTRSNNRSGVESFRPVF